MEPKVSVLGFDVGGRKKGFHAAALVDGAIAELAHFADVRSAFEWSQSWNPEVIAIDAPPVALLPAGSETREAERQLFREGYRIQWTRRAPETAPEWMEHGIELWAALRPLGAVLIETFPTAVSDILSESEVVLPIRWLADRTKRSAYKDYLDAALAAIAADRFRSGAARRYGENDPVGSIVI